MGRGVIVVQEEPSDLLRFSPPPPLPLIGAERNLPCDRGGRGMQCDGGRDEAGGRLEMGWVKRTLFAFRFFLWLPLSRTVLYALSRCGNETAKATRGPRDIWKGRGREGGGAESSNASPSVRSPSPLSCRQFSIYKKVSPQTAYRR